jgi:hypothetical protein
MKAGGSTKSLTKNVEYMHQKYGFFSLTKVSQSEPFGGGFMRKSWILIPDCHFCVLFRVSGRSQRDLGIYCYDKVKLGHYCLYCEQFFKAWQGCQKHMIDLQHTQLRYEKFY